MDKPKRYAVISDDGNTGALIRDALIQKGHLARVARLVKNVNGVIMAQYHDTGREVAVRELVLHWADEVIVAGWRRAGEALAFALSFIHDHRPTVATSNDPQDVSFRDILDPGIAGGQNEPAARVVVVVARSVLRDGTPASRESIMAFLADFMARMKREDFPATPAASSYEEDRPSGSSLIGNRGGS